MHFFTPSTFTNEYSNKRKFKSLLTQIRADNFCSFDIFYILKNLANFYSKPKCLGTPGNLRMAAKTGIEKNKQIHATEQKI